MSIFSSKSFMNRYFQAPVSTGPAKKAKRKGLLRRANREIARENTDPKKVQRLVEKYIEKNK